MMRKTRETEHILSVVRCQDMRLKRKMSDLGMRMRLILASSTTA